MGSEQFVHGMWEYVTLKRAEGKKIREDAARERQEGIHCVEACTTLRMSFSGSEVSVR